MSTPQEISANQASLALATPEDSGLDDGGSGGLEFDENQQSPREMPTFENLPPEIAELFERGAHFGHKKSRVHPSMIPYIVGVRNAVHIIDLQKTIEKLAQAEAFLKQEAAKGKTILFVNTKFVLRAIVKKIAQECGMPYIVEHWAGGTITNWKTISQRIEYFRELEAKKRSEDWEKYPKHERLKMEKELAKLDTQWGGVKELKRVPDVLVILDMHEDGLAVKEARKIGIPVVAIADTNVDIAMVTYPIPCNDDSIAAVEYVLEKFKKAILEGKSEAPNPSPRAKEL